MEFFEGVLEVLTNLILGIWEKITPNKFRKWLDRQNKPVRYVIGPVYYALPFILFVLIVGIIIFLVIGIITLIQVLWKKYV